ncbi:MAG: tetratricopeptide repeat protein [Planctomycetes bacterium]|nr:tetratricopeptide repeat protein [Planctomycetota bacterium]MBI3832969.1 tetratricopeptide repeat protein [Planctomycetota bacterium]
MARRDFIKVSGVGLPIVDTGRFVAYRSPGLQGGSTMWEKQRKCRSLQSSAGAPGIRRRHAERSEASPGLTTHCLPKILRFAQNDGKSVPLLIMIFMAQAAGCAPVQKFEAKREVRHGNALLAKDDLESALAAFQEAARLDPKLAVPHSKMGTIYRRKGEYDQAIHSYTEAVRRDPYSFDDTLNLGQLYQFMNRLREAIQAYLHAVELRPRNADAQLNLGICYQQAGDYSQAAERFEKAIEVNHDLPNAYVNLGVALDAQGKYYEAIRAYKDALERDNRQPQVLVNLSNTYLNQKRYKMARQALIEAIQMDSGFAPAHEALGFCLFKMRDYGAAESAYRLALSCDSRLPRSQAGLGSIHMVRFLENKDAVEERDQALEHWHLSLELNPDQPRLRELLAQYAPPQDERTDFTIEDRVARPR